MYYTAFQPKYIILCSMALSDSETVAMELSVRGEK